MKKEEEVGKGTSSLYMHSDECLLEGLFAWHRRIGNEEGVVAMRNVRQWKGDGIQACHRKTGSRRGTMPE